MSPSSGCFTQVHRSLHVHVVADPPIPPVSSSRASGWAVRDRQRLFYTGVSCCESRIKLQSWQMSFAMSSVRLTKDLQGRQSHAHCQFAKKLIMIFTCRRDRQRAAGGKGRGSDAHIWHRHHYSAALRRSEGEYTMLSVTIAHILQIRPDIHTSALRPCRCDSRRTTASQGSAPTARRFTVTKLSFERKG